MIFVWDPHLEKCYPEDPPPPPLLHHHCSLLASTWLSVVLVIYLSQMVCHGTQRKESPPYSARDPSLSGNTSSTACQPPCGRHVLLLLLHVVCPVGWQDIRDVSSITSA